MYIEFIKQIYISELIRQLSPSYYTYLHWYVHCIDTITSNSYLSTRYLDISNSNLEDSKLRSWLNTNLQSKSHVEMGRTSFVKIMNLLWASIFGHGSSFWAAKRVHGRLVVKWTDVWLRTQFFAYVACCQEYYKYQQEVCIYSSTTSHTDSRLPTALNL